MSNELNGKRIAFLAADGVEKVELDRPREALERSGAQTEVLSLKSGEIQARNHDLEPAGTVGVDRVVADASINDYDGLVLPGGTVNPDKLRLDGSAVTFVRDFVVSGVAAGRKLTSYPSIRTDLRNAGNLITSRSPKDLPAFCATIIKQFVQAPARS